MIVRRLWEGERKDVLELYRSLSEEDRYLRFFSPVGDSYLEAYVGRLDFLRGQVFGAYDGDARLVGVLELNRCKDEFELSLAVGENARGCGVGRALVEKAWEEVRASSVERLVLVCLAENGGMRALAQRLGMATRFADGDIEAAREIPPANPQETLQSFTNEMMSTALWSVAKSWKTAWELGERNSELTVGMGNLSGMGKPGKTG